MATRKVKTRKVVDRFGRTFETDLPKPKNIPFVPREDAPKPETTYSFPLVVTSPPVVKTKPPSEAAECQRLVAYLKMRGLRFTHIPNETTSKRQGVKNKSLGTSKGFPDYCVLVPGSVVFIEMKRRQGGKLSPEQREWIDALNANGQHAYVCAGFEEAKATIEGFL